MKKYTLYLYIEQENCKKNPNFLECHFCDCPSCNLSSYYILDETGEIIEQSFNLDITQPRNYRTNIFTIETNDIIPPNKFSEYLKNLDNDYRLIDQLTNKIKKFNNKDEELLSEIINEDEYEEEVLDDIYENLALENIELYEEPDNIKFLKSKIRNLRIHRNASVILTGGFVLVNTLALDSFMEQPKFIPFAISGITMICGAKNITETRLDNLEIKVGKKLIKKLKDKRNQNT